MCFLKVQLVNKHFINKQYLWDMNLHFLCASQDISNLQLHEGNICIHMSLRSLSTLSGGALFTHSGPEWPLNFGYITHSAFSSVSFCTLWTTLSSLWSSWVQPYMAPTHILVQESLFFCMSELTVFTKAPQMCASAVKIHDRGSA